MGPIWREVEWTQSEGRLNGSNLKEGSMFPIGRSVDNAKNCNNKQSKAKQSKARKSKAMPSKAMQGNAM